MALLVGVISDALVLPPDEKRILASVEKQRSFRIRRNAAAMLIQVTWRRYRLQKFLKATELLESEEKLINLNLRRRRKSGGSGDDSGNVNSGHAKMSDTESGSTINSVTVEDTVTHIYRVGSVIATGGSNRGAFNSDDIGNQSQFYSPSLVMRAGKMMKSGITKVHRMKELQDAETAFREQIWRWRRIKASTDTVSQSLDKEFLVDDTAITTTYISRKLDELEKIVSKGMPSNVAVMKLDKPDKRLDHKRLLSEVEDDLENDEKTQKFKKNGSLTPPAKLRWKNAASALSKPAITSVFAKPLKKLNSGNSKQKPTFSSSTFASLTGINKMGAVNREKRREKIQLEKEATLKRLEEIENKKRGGKVKGSNKKGSQSDKAASSSQVDFRTVEFSKNVEFSTGKNNKRKSPEPADHETIKKPLSSTFSVVGRQNSSAFMTPKSVFEFPSGKSRQFDFSKPQFLNNYQNATRICSTQSMQLSDIGVVMKNQLNIYRI